MCSDATRVLDPYRERSLDNPWAIWLTAPHVLVQAHHIRTHTTRTPLGHQSLPGSVSPAALAHPEKESFCPCHVITETLRRLLWCCSESTAEAVGTGRAKMHRWDGRGSSRARGGGDVLLLQCAVREERGGCLVLQPDPPDPHTHIHTQASSMQDAQSPTFLQ